METMRKLWIGIGLVWLASALPAQAQIIGTPNALLVWDQPAPDLAAAQGYTYKGYADGAPVGQVLSVTCTAGAEPAIFLCRAAFPAFTPAEHTTHVTAGNTAGESLPSNSLTFTFMVLPQAPRGLRIERP